jgi:large subunit ribosomal protein L28
VGKKCEVCGKSVAFGGVIQRRGLPKKRGGVGVKIKGRAKRKFKPNIQRVRVKVGGSAKRMNVCTGCISSGRIEKP